MVKSDDCDESKNGIFSIFPFHPGLKELVSAKPINQVVATQGGYSVFLHVHEHSSSSGDPPVPFCG